MAMAEAARKKLDDLIYEIGDGRFSAVRVLEMYADHVGMRLCKTQMRYARELDEERNDARTKLNKWMMHGKQAYTYRDFPEFIIEEGKRKGIDFEADLYQLAKDSFTLEEQRPNFCISNKNVWFNELGYMRVIACSASMGWCDFEMFRRWQDESGLFVDIGQKLKDWERIG